MHPQDALKLAREAGLDLVEVSPFSKPPVCRIMNYSKYKYEQEKKEKEARKRQHVVKLKEIRYKPNIDEHDYRTKLNHLREFITEGNKVKISVSFRGREMAHKDKGQELIQRIIQDAVDISEIDKAPSQEGRFINLVLMPK
jgi:translation initiation factor IF-3